MSLLAAVLLMQSTAVDFPTVTPHRLTAEESPPVLDGRLDEPIWQQATLIDEFEQLRPQENAPGSERTEVLLSYDSENFYVGIRAHYEDISLLNARQLIQGKTFFSDDRVEVRFDTFNDRRNQYFFQVNPNGMRREALVGNDYFIEEWDTIWYSAAQIHDWGWSAELRIPFKSISFDAEADTWGFNSSRVLPGKGEEHAWVTVNRRINPAESGYIDGLGGMNQGRGIEVAPTVSFQYVDRDSAGSDFSLEPSFTGFYKLRPSLTAALTLNTDFSATEVDDRRVNLTRFSLFFPEKREFFLQDAGIFQFADLGGNGRPFFSRRIGLGADGEPVDLEAGIKLSGRAGPWNIGSLLVQQEAAVPGAAESLFVGRVSRNVLDESTVGAIATYGNPLSPLDNHLLGADFNYRNSSFIGDRTLVARAWAQQTDTEGRDGDDLAWGATVAYPNDRMDWFVTRRRFEENFDPGLGFVNRRGTDQTNGQWRFRHRFDQGRLQWLGGRLQYFRADRIDGGLQTESIYINPLEGFTGGNDFFTFFAGRETEGLVQPFEIARDVTVPAGRYSSNRYGVFFETGQQRTFYGSFEYSTGEFLGGDARFLIPALRWRPNEHLLAGLDYVSQQVELPAGEFTTRIFRLRADIAFNAHWAWLNLAQYDNRSRRLAFNSRLRWLPRADREYFLVLNEEQRRLPDGSFEGDQTDLTLKIGYNYRF